MKLLPYLFIPGIVILFICFFLPIEKICDFEKENGEMAYIHIKGFSSSDYLFGSLFTVIAVLIALFGNGKEAKTGLIITTIIFLFAFAFLRFISSAGFGRPCGSSADEYYNLMLMTQFLLFVLSFIYLNLKIENNKADTF
jgi:hypothetical protein